MRAHVLSCDMIPQDRKDDLARFQEQKEQRLQIKKEHADAMVAAGGVAPKKVKRTHDGEVIVGSPGVVRCVEPFQSRKRVGPHDGRCMYALRGGDSGPDASDLSLPELTTYLSLRLTGLGCLLLRRLARPSHAMVRSLPNASATGRLKLTPPHPLAPLSHSPLYLPVPLLPHHRRYAAPTRCRRAVLDSTSGKPAPEMRIRLDRLNTTGFVLQAQGCVCLSSVLDAACYWWRIWMARRCARALKDEG